MAPKHKCRGKKTFAAHAQVQDTELKDEAAAMNNGWQLQSINETSRET